MARKQDKQEPVIDIPNLAPKDTIGGYLATWKQDDVAAHAELLPLQDQPARGYVLEVYTSNKSGRPMGKRQQERADELIPLVKARMLEAMRLAGWQVTGHLENPPMDIWKPCPIAVLSNQKKQVPVTQTKNVERSRKRRRFNPHQGPITLDIPAREKVSSYKRALAPKNVTGTCGRCGQAFTRLLFPGGHVKYCADCAKEAEKEKTRERVQRLRQATKSGREVHS